MKITIRPTDRLMSILVRRKANGRCEKCERLCEIYEPDGTVTRLWKLEASHYIGRANEATRFDYRNLVALCFLCHQQLGGYTINENGEYDLWMKERLGEKEYKMLKVAAFATDKKRDDVLDMMWLIQECKKIGMNIKEKKPKKEMCCGGKFVKQYCALHMDRKKKSKEKPVDISV